MPLAIDLCELGFVPDPLMRIGMRRLMRDRLASERRVKTEAEYRTRLAALRDSPVAIDTDKANEFWQDEVAANLARKAEEDAAAEAASEAEGADPALMSGT